VISHEEGSYLFPLPMTGKVPETLRELVLTPPVNPEPITLMDITTPDGQPKVVGQGFEVDKEMAFGLEHRPQHIWQERWLVTRSDALVKRKQKTWRNRLQRAEAKLTSLKAKKEESAAALLARAEKIVKLQHLTDIITVQVEETVTQEKRYIGPGRPGPNRPFELREVRHLRVLVDKNESAWAEVLALAGWRIYVTNVSAEILSLAQAMTYYRDEWLVERGFHRFKRGSLPALPLWVRLPERIRGLMLLLLIALQALTLLEFVARRELAKRGETLAGLVPGNPKMKTARPTAERLLARFKNLHLMITCTETQVEGESIEPLTPLQRRILDLLGVPRAAYEIAFCVPASNSYAFHNISER
jgi:transposase